MNESSIERRVAELEATVNEHEERIAALGTDGAGGVSRRTLLQGIGIAGLGGYAVGPGSADPQGQLGTATSPVRVAYLQRLAGGITDGTPIASLLGPGLFVDEEEAALRAALLGATTLGDGEEVLADVADGTLRFRSLVAGRNVNIDRREDELVLRADDGDTNNDGTNLGTGRRVYAGRSGSTLEFRTLTARGALSATESADTVSIGGPWADDDGDTLLEPRYGTGYNGIDLSGAASPRVVTPWIGTRSATAFEAFVDGARAGHFGTEATDLDGNTGAGNVLLGQYASVSGGAVGAAVGGGGSSPDGLENVVADDYGTVSGGGGNQAGSDDGTDNHPYATVGGGYGNTASGQDSTIAGGSVNTASATRAAIGGGNKNGVYDDYGTVAGGGENQAGTDDGTANRPYATVGGGYGNTASGQDSTIAGGSVNTASARKSSVGGGAHNDAAAFGSRVGGGEENVVYDDYATVAGGYRNQAGSNDGDTSTSWGATVPGGMDNAARGALSLAAGHRAKANDAGAFVWADGTDADFASDQAGTGSSPTGADTFHVRSTGGLRLVTGLDANADPNAGVYLASGGSSWQTVSARAAKHDISPVDPAAVLDGVRDLEVSTWAYDSNPGVTHMGPMAGDFHEAFDLGDDPETIGHVDADGVALAAIQGLADRDDELERELEANGDRIATLEGVLAQAADRIASLEAECEAKDDRIDDLEAECEAKDDRIDDLEAECEAKDGRIDDLEDELREQDERVEALESRLSALESSIEGTGD